MNPIRSEQGSALIMALVMITLLALTGLWSTQTSVIETHIAANDKLHQVAFYKANGGAEAAIELLEQNIAERGFPITQENGQSICARGGIAVDLEHSSAQFYANGDIGTSEASKPSCTNRDVYIPRENNSCTPPITNIRIGGNTVLSSGGAIQMISGYEGKGKGAAGGGGWIVYDIRAQHKGPLNSESVVNIRWRHVL